LLSRIIIETAETALLQMLSNQLSVISSDDMVESAAAADRLFHQYTQDAHQLIDSRMLQDICAAAFADCK